MLSTLLFHMSKSGLAKNILLKFPMIKKAKERFVAGENLEEAIKSVKKLNSLGIEATLDILGEEIDSRAEAIKAKNKYLELIDKIHEEKVNSQISLKLSQLGLEISEKFCVENVREILERAKEFKNLAQIDMENYAKLEKTLEIFKALKKDFENIGICVQAYLYRTWRDVKSLLSLKNLNIRLVKGAYKEPKHLAFPKKRNVDKNYIRISKLLLSPESLERGTYPCFGTHDEKIIKWIINYANKNNVKKEKFEFQMLYGVKKDLQEKLAEKGYVVRVYTSFGKDWYAYFMRRMAERPANLWFVLKQMFH